MSITFNPVFSWPVVVVGAIAVLVPTLWVYYDRLRGTSGRWRWVALGLRLAAVLLCLLAALRPSVVLPKKDDQTSLLVFLRDASTSMAIADEAGGRSRWDASGEALDEALKVTKKVPRVEEAVFTFDRQVHEIQAPGAPKAKSTPAKADDEAKAAGRPATKAGAKSKAQTKSKAAAATAPGGHATALGDALSEILKRLEGRRIAGIVLFSDGASNVGDSPLTAAQRLRNQQVPVVAVGFGKETAGDSSRDVAVRDLAAGPTVFVKNELEVRGTLAVRGFANQPIDVELIAEGQALPVARTQVKVAEGAATAPIRMSWTPQTPGETKLTLRAVPREGELVQANNEISTFVTVLKGGINVLYVQGPNFSWEYKYLYRAINASQEINTDLVVVRKPAEGDRGELADTEFAPGRYDVYILGDVAAAYFTPVQQALLTRAVERGAGLMALGGRDSFGAGGWDRSPLAAILPTEIHAGDGQLEPEGGLPVVPNEQALDSYVLRLADDRSESRRIWQSLPPLTGASRLGPPKPAARVLATTPDGEPVMAAQDNVGKGRVLAFGGETWVWARALDLQGEGRLAHQRFWRQAILWLAHKEDQGESQVKLALAGRRVAQGEKLDLTVTATGPKGESLADVEYKIEATRVGPGAVAEEVPSGRQGAEAHATYYATGEPGEYRISVKGTRAGKELGSDTARFLVYEEDRELDNPAADLALLRQIAQMTGGAAVPPEQLAAHLRKLAPEVAQDAVSQVEHRLWDNWPVLLIFVALLTAEWWLRKRHGWV